MGAIISKLLTKCKSKLLLTILSFCFAFTLANASSNSSTNFLTNPEFQELTIEIQYENGEIVSYCVDTEIDFMSIMEVKNVVVCTITDSQSGCSCTGPTCAAASACFYSNDGCADPIDDNTGGN